MHRVLLAIIFWISGCFIFSESIAQDTLPGFTAKKVPNGKVILSWKNQYPDIVQLTVQRSPNGKTAFTSILTVPDPKLEENGFMDVAAPHNNFFYRLYILRSGGNYSFSAVKTAELDTNSVHITPNMGKTGNTPFYSTLPPNSGQPIVVKIGSTIAGVISDLSLKSFRDSILYKTKDTLLFLSKDTIQIQPFSGKEVFRASNYVYTIKDGNVQLNLPANGFPYKLRFFDVDSNELIFELDNITTSSLMLDKSNFLKAGWFRFELFKHNVLFEKHKVYIPKDF